MKRALVAMAVAATGLAAGWAFWSAHAPKYLPTAATLLPPETLALAECPDLPGTWLRWRQTALAQILREPEVANFLAQPRALLGQNEAWSQALRQLARAQPRHAFLAVASITQNMPHAVGGVAFAGERGAAEALVARAFAQAQAASPSGKRESEDHGKFRIESFSDNGITFAGCFAGGWYFVANDVELLKSTLDRFSGKPRAGLDATLAYRKCMRRLPLHPDFRLFAQPGVESDKLIARLGMWADPDTQLAAPPQLGKIRAIALGARFEGLLLRERLFVFQPDAVSRPRLSRKTLGLTTPNTLFYGALAPLLSEGSPRTGPSSPPPAHPLRVLLGAFSPPPATLAQFKSAFGPEHALLLNWPADAQPNLYLAMEVRDPIHARKFVENAFRAWSRADAAGVSYWVNRAQSPIHPAVALTDRHFLAGLSPESLEPFASSAVNAPAQGGTLENSPAFTLAMESVSKPEIGMAYLDAQPLFERFYAWLRPAILLWGSAKLGSTFDFGQLPSPASIGKHLTPITLSASQSSSGILMESTGPVTFLEVSAGVGAVASAVLLPALRANPGTPIPRENRPLLPSPLSAPQNAAPSATPETPGASPSSDGAPK